MNEVKGMDDNKKGRPLKSILKKTSYTPQINIVAVGRTNSADPSISNNTEFVVGARPDPSCPGVVNDGRKDSNFGQPLKVKKKVSLAEFNSSLNDVVPNSVAGNEPMGAARNVVNRPHLDEGMAGTMDASPDAVENTMNMDGTHLKVHRKVSMAHAVIVHAFDYEDADVYEESSIRVGADSLDSILNSVAANKASDIMTPVQIVENFDGNTFDKDGKPAMLSSKSAFGSNKEQGTADANGRSDNGNKIINSEHGCEVTSDDVNDPTDIEQPCDGSQVKDQDMDSGMGGNKDMNAWNKPLTKPMLPGGNEHGGSFQQKRAVRIKELHNDEVVEGAAVAIPSVAVEEIRIKFANTLYGYFIGKPLAFMLV